MMTVTAAASSAVAAMTVTAAPAVDTAPPEIHTGLKQLLKDLLLRLCYILGSYLGQVKCGQGNAHS